MLIVNPAVCILAFALFEKTLFLKDLLFSLMYVYVCQHACLKCVVSLTFGTYFQIMGGNREQWKYALLF